MRATTTLELPDKEHAFVLKAVATDGATPEFVVEASSAAAMRVWMEVIEMAAKPAGTTLKEIEEKRFVGRASLGGML